MLMMPRPIQNREDCRACDLDIDASTVHEYTQSLNTARCFVLTLFQPLAEVNTEQGSQRPYSLAIPFEAPLRVSSRYFCIRVLLFPQEPGHVWIVRILVPEIFIESLQKERLFWGSKL